MTRHKATRTVLRFKYNGGERGFTQHEAALKLGVSVRTIQRMIIAGKLACFELHRRRWISPLSIEEYLFEPSRLAQILAEIDRIAEMMKDRHPGRHATREQNV